MPCCVANHNHKRRFNIAYIPTANQTRFIELAKEQARIAQAATYCLGPSSLPHVSLCHFMAEEHHIPKIWAEIGALKLSMLNLRFESIRDKSYSDDSPYGGLSWISLMPNHLQELADVHLKIAKIIKHPLNHAYQDYDPHLTLLNSKNKAACLLLSGASIAPPIEDDFILALGTIDAVGQLTKILYVDVELG